MYLICNYKSFTGSESLILRKEFGVLGCSVTLLTRKELNRLGLPISFVKTLMVGIPKQDGGFEKFQLISDRWGLSDICFFDGQLLYPSRDFVGNLLKKKYQGSSVCGLFFFIKLLNSLHKPLKGVVSPKNFK